MTLRRLPPPHPAKSRRTELAPAHHPGGELGDQGTYRPPRWPAIAGALSTGRMHGPTAPLPASALAVRRFDSSAADHACSVHAFAGDER